MTEIMLFAAAVLLLALGLGWALGWSDRGGRRLLDPSRLDWEMLNDPRLDETDRAYVREMTALELTRRHICC